MLIRASISVRDSLVGGRESRLLTSGAIWALQSVKFQFLHQSFAGQAQKTVHVRAALMLARPAFRLRRAGEKKGE